MMKRILMAVLCCLLAMAAGCAPKPSLSEEPQTSSSQAEPLEPPAETPVPPAEGESQLPLTVADAAMYRGTVVELTTAQDGVLLTLRQPEGVDFGAATMKFFVNEDTRLSFGRELLTTGEFLEIYYGEQPQSDEAAKQAIAINRYLPAEAVNYNGSVQEYLPSADKPGTGTLRMRELKSGQIVWFHFNEETQFYLDASAIKAGDQLNIFHRGMFAMSEPPQGYALEVRQYRQTNAYSSTGASI